ncbi:hypothetical protein DENSPDRAFT_840334 [Dentipellis sp. KUC8613]|nr:hypothetical protein DENSPDRAFT_840334 [Dentipellis sp. KUC8613]
MSAPSPASSSSASSTPAPSTPPALPNFDDFTWDEKEAEAWLQAPDPYTEEEKKAYLAEYAALGPAILEAESEPDPVKREKMLNEADGRLTKLALRPKLFQIAVAGES